MAVSEAEQILLDQLTEYGLGDLLDVALQEIRASGGQINEDRLVANLRQTEQYKQRFRGMGLRRQQGYAAIDEGQYLQLEQNYRDVMRRAGLPIGFYDSPDDFANYIGNNVSPAEISERVFNGYVAVRQADPSVRAELDRLYGVTDGELAAFFLDPQRAEPLIQQQVTTARVGAAAARQGFDVNRTALERMTALGVDEQGGRQIFDTLGASRELLTGMDPSEQSLSVEETAVGLAGGSPEAARRLRQRQQRRVAEFQGGGQFASQGGQNVGLQTA
jgi:hypothetical protein